MKKLIILVLIVFNSTFAIGQHIVDNGKFFNENQKEIINGKIKEFISRNYVEIFVYTTEALKGISTKEFGVSLSYKYPTGKKGINNGIIILFSQDKIIQLLNGYGIEWIINDNTSQIIIDEIIEYFKNGDFTNGIINSIDYIDNLVSDYSWVLKKTKLENVTSDDVGKIIKFKYNNTVRNGKYKYCIDTDPQFSSDYKIVLKAKNSEFNLYYSKYMNDMLSKITTNRQTIIYARLTDWDNKKLELVGIE